VAALVVAGAALHPASAFADPAGAVDAAGQATQSALVPADQLLHRVGRVHNYEYSTVGPDGSARNQGRRTSTAQLILPAGPAPAGGWPVVVYAHGTTGRGDSCAPSRQPLYDLKAGLYQQWLDAGFAIVAPDYIGLGTPGEHPYLDTRSTGASLIDAVAAALELTPDLSGQWFATGDSQGGHAAIAAASMVDSYRETPGQQLAGVAANGLPVYLDSYVSLAGPGIPEIDPSMTVFFAYLLGGLQESRPDVRVAEYLTPVGQTIVDQARTQCFNELYETVR
jgi:hypothetical protein